MLFQLSISQSKQTGELLLFVDEFGKINLLRQNNYKMLKPLMCH